MIPHAILMAIALLWSFFPLCILAYHIYTLHCYAFGALMLPVA